MKKLYIIFISAAIILGILSVLVIFKEGEWFSPKVESVILWKGNDEIQYRIPGIVTTKSGTILTYCEARKEKDDWSQMNIELKRSKDGGKTWGEIQTLAVGTEHYPTVNNPVMIVDSNNTIHFIYCSMYGVEDLGGNIFYRYSTDDGASWSDAQMISDKLGTDIRNVIATGPGHGICNRDDVLIIPIWMVLKDSGANIDSHYPAVVSTIYSQDYGQNWEMGEIIFPGIGMEDLNESTVVELSDGSVLINMRNNNPGKKLRAVASSDTGYSNWSSPIFVEELIDPICFGSLLKYNENTILFINAESQEERENITLKYSVDDCVSWSNNTLLLKKKNGGYSDISSFDNVVYALVEDNSTGNFSIEFYSIPIKIFLN